MPNFARFFVLLFVYLLTSPPLQAEELCPRNFKNQTEALRCACEDWRPSRIWGTDVYTNDSHICTAAVHAGVIRQGEASIVAVEPRPGQDAYSGSTRHGVKSGNYGKWGKSFAFKQLPRVELQAANRPEEYAGVGPLDGMWVGTLRCGSSRPIDVALELTGAPEDPSAVVSIYGRDFLNQSVPSVRYVGRGNPDSGYRFVLDDRRPGKVLRHGFELGPVANNQSNITSRECKPATVARLVTGDPRATPTTQAAAAGTFYAASDLEGHCITLADWVSALEREYPDVNWRRTRGRNLYEKAAPLFFDDAFVPVFGEPFDTIDVGRIDAASKTRLDCSRDPFAKSHSDLWNSPVFDVLRRSKEHRNPNAFYGGAFSAAGIAHVIRENRALKHALSRPLEFEDAERLLARIEGGDQSLLWPSEVDDARAQLSGRLAVLAEQEADKLLTLLNSKSNPTEALQIVHSGRSQLSDGKLSRLPKNREIAFRRELDEITRNFVAQIAEPVLSAAVTAEMDVDGAVSIQRTLKQLPASLPDLRTDDRQIVEATLEEMRDVRLHSTIAGDLETLASFRAGLSGLEAGADWLASFQRAYEPFKDHPLVTSARQTFDRDRAERIEAALPEFEERVQSLDASEAAVLKKRYLAMPQDERLPIALSYEISLPL